MNEPLRTRRSLFTWLRSTSNNAPATHPAEATHTTHVNQAPPSFSLAAWYETRVTPTEFPTVVLRPNLPSVPTAPPFAIAPEPEKAKLP